MMRNTQTGLVVALFAALLTLSACDQNDGPMEKAGEKIDSGYENTKEIVSDTVEDVSAKAEDMMDKTEDKVD